jgi:zinc transport system substrate-binding protein
MKHSSKFIIILTCAFFVFLSTGCSSTKTSSQKNSKSKPIIAVSIVPEATLVKAVAGDLVDVVTMIPAGKSPANYSPSPEEMQKFSSASIYFTIGVPTEEANILPKVNNFNKDVKLISLADAVEKVYPHRYFHNENEELNNITSDEHHHEGKDPHIWLSPKRAIIMVDTIAKELGTLDKSHKNIYIENADKYIEKLKELDKNIENSLEGLQNKSFIVYHPSFGYFADDYGLKMITLEQGGKEASAKDIEKAIDFARENNIKVIFYQAEIDSKQSKTFAESINGKAEQIAPLAPDYIENLQKIADTFRSTLDEK